MSLNRTEVAALVQTRIGVLRSGHPTIDAFLRTIEGVGQWGLVGGALRDWVLFPDKVPHDYDFALDLGHGRMVGVIREFLAAGPPEERVLHRRTGYGGFALKLDGLLVEAWSARRPHGIFSGAEPSADVFQATADFTTLTLDTLMMTSSGKLYDSGFFETLTTRVIGSRLAALELRVAQFPDNAQQAYTHIADKARRYCELHGFTADDELRAFIAKHASPR